MTTNPLIDDLVQVDAIPSVTISLPTGGRFYHLSVFADGTDPTALEVGTLGIVAEQNYRDPFQLASGLGLPKLIGHVCPNVLRAEELAEVDIDAILVATRMVRYGPMMSLQHICTHPQPTISEEPAPDQPAVEEKLCNYENKVEINLQEFILRYSPITNLDEFVVSLRIGQKVQLRPMPYRAAMAVLKQSMVTQKEFGDIDSKTLLDFVVNDQSVLKYDHIVDIATEASVQALIGRIYSVTRIGGFEVHNRAQIEEWLLNLPLPMVGEIRDRVNQLSEQLRKIPEVTYVCRNCSNENSISVQLDPQKLFFFEPEASVAPMMSSGTLPKRGKTGNLRSKISQR